MILVTAVSDTHGYLPRMQPSDLAVICGDIFPGEMDKDPMAQGKWFRDTFIPWVEQIECNRVILIAGNHDHWIAVNNQVLLKEFAPSEGGKLVYLCDSGFEYKELKIYGTPWVPVPFHNLSFSLDDDGLRKRYALIPKELDLLLTHTVPYDCNHIGFSDHDMKDLGCKELRKAVESRNIRFLIGGHIHDSSERVAHMDFGDHHTEMANVACCNSLKIPSRLPLRFSL